MLAVPRLLLPLVGHPRPAEEGFLVLMPCPGSTATRQKNDGRDSESAFTTDTRLRDVYEHFHQRLVRDGWRRQPKVCVMTPHRREPRPWCATM